MRKKLKALISLLTMAALMLPMAVMPVFAEGETEKYTAPDSPSITYNMNADWKFRKAVSGAQNLAEASAAIKQNSLNFYDTSYDDSTWENVSLPHPANASESFEGTIKNSGDGGIYRGFMFYRKKLTIPSTDAGKKFFLEFESVRNSVYLYVNGEFSGYYEAGIVASGYDITPYIKAGQENVIALATENTSDRGRTDFIARETINDGAHTPGDLSGVGFQWNSNEFNETQGGISGNVNLYAKGKIYQTLPLYNNLKTKGNYIYATDFNLHDPNNSKAKIHVDAEIRNETAADKALTLQVDIVDMDGKKAYTFTQTGTAKKAADTATAIVNSVVPADAYDGEPAATNWNTIDVSYINASADLENLRLWSPDDPYLYTVYTILKEGETVIDVQEKKTGFRQVVYDYDGSNGGFKINGEPIFLKGYSQRSTNEWAAIGVAPDWLSDYDMELVRESNANFIRWMHVAPKPATIRSTDKYGVVSVCPAGDKEADADGRQWAQRVEAMRDAIIYYRNSPSIIFWEAGNNAVSGEHMKEMYELKHAIDPDGNRLIGCRSINTQDQLRWAEYAGTMVMTKYAGEAQDSMVKLGKYIPLMETEHSRGESPRRVWDDFSPYFAISATEMYNPATDGVLYDYPNKFTVGDSGKSIDGLDTWDYTQEDIIVRENIPSYANFYNARVGGTGSQYATKKGADYETHTGVKNGEYVTFTINQYVAEALMNWTDSNQHGRMTVTENSRSSGKVDPVRIKKGTFYALQAAQSTKPAVHIVGHWNYEEQTNDNYWYWEKKRGTSFYENDHKAQRDPQHKTVYVIGSYGLEKVELYIDDVLQKTVTQPTSNHIFAFTDIDVTKGNEVKAIGYDAQGRTTTHLIERTGVPEKIELEPHTGPKGFLADGSDIMYFDISVKDSQDRVCPLSYDQLKLEVSGEAVLMGGYNSGSNANSYDPTSKKATIYAENGLNRVFLRSTRTAGPVTLKVTSGDGKMQQSFTLPSSTAVTVNGGLMTEMQQSKVPGIKEVVIKETVPAMKPLAKPFKAVFAAVGNTPANVRIVEEQEITVDLYNITVNNSPVTLDEKSYIDTGALWIQVDAVIKALQTAGAPITEINIAQDGSSVSFKYNGTKLTVKAADSDIYINDTDRDGPMVSMPVITESGHLMADPGTLFGHMPGITTDRDDESKVFKITYTAQ